MARWTGGTILTMLAAAGVAFATGVGTNLVHDVSPQHSSKDVSFTSYPGEVITATAAGGETFFLKWDDTAAGCTSAAGPTPATGPVGIAQSAKPCSDLFDWTVAVSSTSDGGLQATIVPTGPAGYYLGDDAGLARGDGKFLWTLAHQGNGTYELQAAADSTCLTMDEPDQTVLIATCNPNNVDQDWSLTFLPAPNPSAGS